MRPKHLLIAWIIILPITCVLDRISAASKLPEAIDYAVPGTIVTLAQPSSNTCWATAATILVSWKEMRSIEISEVMERAGAMYRTKFDNNRGLSGSEKSAFLN